MVSERVSPNTVEPSSKVTPCFRAFDLAFFLSHSNVKGIYRSLLRASVEANNFLLPPSYFILSCGVFVFESANFGEELIGKDATEERGSDETECAKRWAKRPTERETKESNVGLLESCGLEDVDNLAFGCDCFCD
jgi:hypothetical protein